MHRQLASTLLVIAALLLAGCGGSPTAGSPPYVRPATQTSFPKPRGDTLSALAGRFPIGPVLAPLVAVFDPGRRRFAFRLYDRSRKQIGGAPVALYIASGPDGTARGPYHAGFRRHAARHRGGRPAARHRKVRRASWVYLAWLRVPRAGTYNVLALIQLDGRLVGAPPVEITVTTDQQR